MSPKPRIICNVTHTGKLKKYINNWINCTDCTLHETRKKVVLYRGHIPADILVIGEAPGEAEDDLGAPMVGPTRAYIEMMFKEISDTYPHLKYGITNILACRPPNNRNPMKSEAEACQYRLMEAIDMVNPGIIFRMGNVAQRYATHVVMMSSGTRRFLDLQHPAKLVRMVYAGAKEEARVEYKDMMMKVMAFLKEHVR